MEPESKRKLWHSSRQNSPERWEMSRKRIRRGEAWAHVSYCISPFFSPEPLIPVIGDNKKNQRQKLTLKEKITSWICSPGVLGLRVTLCSLWRHMWWLWVHWSYLNPRSFFSISWQCLFLSPLIAVKSPPSTSPLPNTHSTHPLLYTHTHTGTQMYTNTHVHRYTHMHT